MNILHMQSRWKALVLLLQQAMPQVLASTHSQPQAPVSTTSHYWILDTPAASQTLALSTGLQASATPSQALASPSEVHSQAWLDKWRRQQKHFV